MKRVLIATLLAAGFSQSVFADEKLAGAKNCLG